MKKTRKEIVKMLLEQSSECNEELIDLLVDEPIAINIDKEEESKMSFADKVSDKIAEIAGSWIFIICFIIFLILWIVFNIYIMDDVDPYPFILLNLVLSCLAAIQAPIIMMSQNRQAEKDSLRNQNDYLIDLKSELILESLHNQMEEILKNQKKILKRMEEENGIERK